MFILPEWNGKVVGDLHRYGISRQALADATGYTRSYISKILNSFDPPIMAMSNINAALDKLIRRIKEDDARRDR